jgi:hypothetical protein
LRHRRAQSTSQHVAVTDKNLAPCIARLCSLENTNHSGLRFRTLLAEGVAEGGANQLELIKV